MDTILRETKSSELAVDHRNAVNLDRIHALPFMQIQELETENSELKQQLQDLEEQLMISHVSPVRTNTHTHTPLQFTDWTKSTFCTLKVYVTFV